MTPYVEEEAVVNPGRTTTIELRLRPMATLLGHVENVSTDSLLKGVRVHLVGAGGRLLQEAVTGDDGAYRFSGLQPGSYTLRCILPKGYLLEGSADRAVEISGGGETRMDFRVFRHGSVEGRVVAEGGEPMPNADVLLVDSTGATIRTSKTDTEGRYAFPDVPVDKYRVRVEVPENYAA